MEENIEIKECDFKDILYMKKIKGIFYLGSVWFTGYVIKIDNQQIDNNLFKGHYNARIKWKLSENNYVISNCILKNIKNMDNEIIPDKYLIHSIKNKLFEEKLQKIDNEYINNYNDRENYNIDEEIETNYGENNYPFCWINGIITAFINDKYTVKINENEINVNKHMIRKKGSLEQNIKEDKEIQEENDENDENDDENERNVLIKKLLQELEFLKQENDTLKDNLEITCSNSSVLENDTLKKKMKEYEDKILQQKQEQEIKIKEQEERENELLQKLENVNYKIETLQKITQK